MQPSNPRAEALRARLDVSRPAVAMVPTVTIAGLVLNLPSPEIVRQQVRHRPPVIGARSSALAPWIGIILPIYYDSIVYRNPEDRRIALAEM